MGVLNKIFAGLAPKPGKADQLVIDATHPKARGTAASPKKNVVFVGLPDVKRRAELQTTRRVRWPYRNPGHSDYMP